MLRYGLRDIFAELLTLCRHSRRLLMIIDSVPVNAHNNMSRGAVAVRHLRRQVLLF